MQRGADGLPGDVVIGLVERRACTSLEFGVPSAVFICIGHAVQAGEQIGREFRAIGDWQCQGVVEQLARVARHARRIAPVGGWFQCQQRCGPG